MTPEKAAQLFAYDPETGLFWRLIDYGNGKAGQIIDCGRVSIDSKSYILENVIWAIHHGSWPPEGYRVDHKNGRRGDRRLLNLRLATPTQNMQNRAGYGQYAKGVTWRDRKTKPWQAKIRVNGDRIHLGSFETEEEAAETYRQAAIHYHGEFANVE